MRSLAVVAAITCSVIGAANGTPPSKKKDDEGPIPPTPRFSGAIAGQVQKAALWLKADAINAQNPEQVT